jgi:hypothetical protein
MTREELVAFCEQEIQEHSRKVRALLDLLNAARMLPENYGHDFDDEDDDGP